MVNAEGLINLLQCTVPLLATPDGHASNNFFFEFTTRASRFVLFFLFIPLFIVAEISRRAKWKGSSERALTFLHNRFVIANKCVHRDARANLKLSALYQYTPSLSFLLEGHIPYILVSRFHPSGGSLDNVTPSCFLLPNARFCSNEKISALTKLPLSRDAIHIVTRRKRTTNLICSSSCCVYPARRRRKKITQRKEYVQTH